MWPPAHPRPRPRPVGQLVPLGERPKLAEPLRCCRPSSSSYPFASPGWLAHLAGTLKLQPEHEERARDLPKGRALAYELQHRLVLGHVAEIMVVRRLTMDLGCTHTHHRDRTGGRDRHDAIDVT